MKPVATGELSNCENEPLEWSGRIQAAGALVVADEAGRVSYHSENWTDFFDIPSGDDTLTLTQLFGDDAERFEYRQQPLFAATHYLIRDVTTNRGVTCDVVRAVGKDASLYELRRSRPSDKSAANASVQVELRDLPLAAGVDVAGMLRRIHALSGCSKIMIYRFLEDGAGEVVAELTDGALDPYIGLRFPSSDVPRIARQLYVDNPFRLIFDIEGETSPVVARRPDGRQVDLSLSMLRSVSPLHLEYLSNMRVRASASFSIRVTGKLWGLVALHAVEPLSADLPSWAEVQRLVNDELAVPLMDYQIKEAHRRFGASAKTLEDFAAFLVDGLGEPTAHARLPAGAAEMIDCDGLLVFLDGQLVLCEADVSAEEAETLRAAAAPLVSQTQFATESMVRYFDQSDDLARRASGLLYERGLIGRPRARRLEICWLRPEKTVAVHWAGRPEKGERVEDGTVRISPRQSFEKWTSLSRATAEPWRQSDLLLANRLMLRAMTRANHVP